MILLFIYLKLDSILETVRATVMLNFENRLSSHFSDEVISLLF